MPFLSLRFVSTPGTTAALAYRIALTRGRVYAWSNLVVNTFFGWQSNVFACFGKTRTATPVGPSMASPSTLAVKS
jgi:hypothetical protein